jgi:hypothetical protein
MATIILDFGGLICFKLAVNQGASPPSSYKVFDSLSVARTKYVIR